MEKQFEFYSYKNDDEMIANTLRSVFGELLCVPRYKGDLSPFDICANDRLMYLTGKSFQQYISYYTHEYYDGTMPESPISHTCHTFRNNNFRHKAA